MKSENYKSKHEKDLWTFTLKSKPHIIHDENLIIVLMHWSAVKKSGIVYLKPWTQFRICINKEKMCTILLYYINHKIIRERIYICPCVLETVQKVYMILCLWKQFRNCICFCVRETVQQVYISLCSRKQFRKCICYCVQETCYCVQ